MHAVGPEGMELFRAVQAPLFVSPSDDGPDLNTERFLAPPLAVLDSPETMVTAKGNYVGVLPGKLGKPFANFKMLFRLLVSEFPRRNRME